jgi:hypothetical protein
VPSWSHPTSVSHPPCGQRLYKVVEGSTRYGVCRSPESLLHGRKKIPLSHRNTIVTLSGPRSLRPAIQTSRPLAHTIPPPNLVLPTIELPSSRITPHIYSSYRIISPLIHSNRIKTTRHFHTNKAGFHVQPAHHNPPSNHIHVSARVWTSDRSIGALRSITPQPQPRHTRSFVQSPALTKRANDSQTPIAALSPGLWTLHCGDDGGEGTCRSLSHRGA